MCHALKEEERTETWLFIISSRTQNKIKNRRRAEEPRTEGRPSRPHGRADICTSFVLKRPPAVREGDGRSSRLMSILTKPDKCGNRRAIRGWRGV